MNRKKDIIEFLDTVTIKNDDNKLNANIKHSLSQKFDEIEDDDQLLVTYENIKEDDVLKIIPLDESYIMICKVVDIQIKTDIDTNIETVEMIHVKVLRNKYSKEKQYCRSYKIIPHKFHLLKSKYNADQYYNTIIQLAKQMHLW